MFVCSRKKVGFLLRSKYVCLRLEAGYKYFGKNRLLMRLDNPRDLILGKRLILSKNKIASCCSSLISFLQQLFMMKIYSLIVGPFEISRLAIFTEIGFQFIAKSGKLAI